MCIRDRLSTQLITYGLYLTLSNAAQISNLDASYTSDLVIKPMFRLGNTPVMSYVAFAIIVTAIMWFIWNKTTFGKNMFAVGSNEEAARVSGVNVTMVIIGVFALAGVTYGYTGFIEAARMGASTGTIGLNYELDAIAACVIGGVSFVGGIGKISGVDVYKRQGHDGFANPARKVSLRRFLPAGPMGASGKRRISGVD